MIYEDHCVLCQSDHIDRYPAALSAFIQERVFTDILVRVELIHCQQCGFIFYNPRLEKQEILKLYDGYRNHAYQQMRQRHEPWYTDDVNQAIGKGAVELTLRKKNMLELFLRHMQLEDVKTVLDYGGDKGQFILDNFCNAKKYVYEISNVSPCNGVTSINCYEDLDEYDLVMCCHVFEHESYPNQLMEKIIPTVKSGGFLYIELPVDNPVLNEPGSFLKKGIKKFLWENSFIARRLSLIFPRIRFGVMHEHINHFSLNSLEKMVLKNKLTVVSMFEREMDMGWMRINVLCCLAKKEY